VRDGRFMHEYIKASASETELVLVSYPATNTGKPENLVWRDAKTEFVKVSYSLRQKVR
jgi:predicted alpha/beta-hydrolase family hydrolase